MAGQYVGSQPQRVQQEVEAGREITVSGTGKALSAPNVAKYTLGVVTGSQTTAEGALKILSDRSQAVVKAITSEGVAEKDIATTNLSVNPVYDFSRGQQEIRGFEASQSVEVTIRNLDKIGVILAKATGEGANQAGGLTFTVDDIEKVRSEAQAEAIAEAREKAKQLAQALGVGLGRVKTFSASEVAPPGPLPYATRAESAATAPAVPAGTQEIQVSVTITYELR